MTPVLGGASAVLACPRDGDTNLPTDTFGTALRLLMASHDGCVTAYSGHHQGQGGTWGQTAMRCGWKAMAGTVGMWAVTVRLLNIALPKPGADLFRFGNRNKSAVAESLRGLGNDTNDGVRTLVSDKKALYVGTANPMNLHPDGGWELLQLKKD